MNKLPLVALASLLTACTLATSGDPTCAPGSCEAPSPTPRGPVDPAPVPTITVPEEPPTAGTRTTPELEIIASGLNDAIDFDVRGADVIVLRASPSRIESCSNGACSPLVGSAQMPAEDASQEASRSNASLAFVGATAAPAILVAQKGWNKCGVDCTNDIVSQAGLYSVRADAAPTRRGSTIPLVFAKAARGTDGWLVGRGKAWAVSARSNNEGPQSEFAAIVFRQNPIAIPLALESATFLRGHFGAGAPLQPFTFVAATTPAGEGGYVGASDGFIDIASGTKTDFAPTAATITTNNPVNASVFFRREDTADGVVMTFANFGAHTPREVAFPGLSSAASLDANDAQVGFISPAGSVALHVCEVAALLGGTCAPSRVTLPLSRVIRVRASGSAFWVMGTMEGKPAIVKVTAAF